MRKIATLQGYQAELSAIDGLVKRVASRFIAAGLGQALERKIEDLLKGEYSAERAQAVGVWFAENFRVEGPRTPRGQKELKHWGQGLRWNLQHGGELRRAEVVRLWAQIYPRISDLVRYFTEEGITKVPKELILGSRIYLNQAGLDSQKLQRYAKRIDTIFKGVTGWRARALVGRFKVVFASPKSFRGTSSGVYRASEDALYVRTTPAVVKRTEGYGSFDYVIIHELGHRYEKFARLPLDFDRPQWWTSRYSRKEGEAFAELFAIGHFGTSGAWSEEVIDRFEKVMLGASFAAIEKGEG